MINISKAKIKLIASLRERKHRRELGLFAVEGTKSVLDTLPYFRLHMLTATAAWLETHDECVSATGTTYRATAAQLSQMSALSTAPDVIAVYELPHMPVPSAPELRGNVTLLLDDIQDPGNLGTIVRCADWFGVRNIVASPHTVDIFNPKAIQSSMGALSRVKVSYCPLGDFLDNCPDIPLYGTLLSGSNIYEASLPGEALIVMGNEGRGISEEIRRRIDIGLLIPSWPPGAPVVDSLNVAMATAIVLGEWRRPR